ncbi:hypothetical protein [Micromonospora parva]|uniref:hypothetical protein n=1 Tax=Micromonospora parva TaxID=1464048 RepID=UPI0012DE4A99|nr:hypothetical protein [Micromonospora parva]
MPIEATAARRMPEDIVDRAEHVVLIVSEVWVRVATGSASPDVQPSPPHVFDHGSDIPVRILVDDPHRQTETTELDAAY